MYIHRLFFLLLLAISTILSAQTQTLEHVTVRLAWKHQFEFAGFYAAKEKGFYKEAGLNVEIKEYDPKIDTVEEVLSGASTYGLFSSQLILKRLSGKKVVNLASYFKQNALVLITKPEIKSVDDLKGKKVMATQNQLKYTSLATMLHNHDITLSDIEIIPPTFDTSAFEKGEVDAISAFVSNEPFILDKKKIPYSILNPSDDGIYSYDNELFTSEDEAVSHPLKTKKFIEATRKGWEYALSHKNEIVDLIYQKYSQKKSKEALLYEAKVIEKLIKPNLYPIGIVVPELVKLNTNMYTQLGMVDSNWNLEGFMFDPNAKKINLTPEEEAFIHTHPKIVLGTEKEWKPSVIVNEDGSISGFDADVLTLINKVSGANFTLKAGKWQEMIEQAKQKKIDGLSSGTIHKERMAYLNFSDIYATMPKMLFISKENPKNIHSLHDLKGKTIAVYRSNLFDEKYARQFKSSKIIKLQSVNAVIEAVVTGKADVMIGDATTFYLANEMGLPYLKRIHILNKKLDLVFSVRKDWPEAISIINKSLAYIGKDQLIQLQNKWFGQDQATALDKKYQKISLTSVEKAYLNEKKKITLCVDPDWLPFEKIENGKHIGMSADYFELISSKIGIPIDLIPTTTWEESLAYAKARKCDILSFAMETPSRKTYLNFTEPLLDIPLVIATTYDQFFISDFDEIKGKKIGIVKGYALKEVLQSKYPEIEWIEVTSVEEGLKNVIRGETFGFIDNLTAIGYQIQKNFPGSLKISGKFNEKWELSLGVRSDEQILLEILNKAVASIDAKTKQKIINSWISIKYEQGFDYILLGKILTPFILIALFLLMKQRVMHRYNIQLKNEVNQKIEELREKDKMLISKYRMAAMGEVISLIAHQWKQPLAAISSTLTGIKVKLASGQFDLEDQADQEKFLLYLEKKHNRIGHYVQFLSDTTDEFRNFFNPKKHKELISLHLPIKNALQIVQASMQKHGITVLEDLQIDTELMLNKNEMIQVVLNLLKNSEDNFLAHTTPHPKIIITTYREHDRYVIRICDNGGGIPKEYIKNIFDPYFTTKNENIGTGLGLYMSKIIVEDHHGGLLNVYNTDEGVCFEIIFTKEIA